MKLSDLIHYRVDTSNMTHQQKLVRLMLCFLAVMLALTLLSRGMDSLTVAQVSAQGPKSGAIEHTVRADGVLEANREIATLALDNVLVESVEVHEGAAVKEGDLLFQLSMTDLQRQLREKQLERDKLALELQELRLQKDNAAVKEEREQAKAQQRADEDYDLTLEEYTEKVRRAKKVREDAADALDAFRDDYDWDDWDKPTVGDSDDDYTNNGLTYSQAKEKFNSLKAEWEAAKEALKDAEREQEAALIRAERAVEDANEQFPEDPTLQPDILSLSIQIADFAMDDLRKAIAAEGKIVAAADGVVTKLNVSTGQRTSTEASAVIAEAAEGYRLRVSLDSEEAKRIVRGDKVSVTLSGKTRGTESVVESLTPSAANPGGVDAVVMVQEGEIGQSASLELSKRSESYQQCVPISAVHGASGDQYVLVIDERDTVLGKQQVARKVPVTVADSNETRAALTGAALQNSDKVIVSSSKNVFEGDRVRLEESAS